MVKVISLPYIFQVLYALCFTRPRYQVSVYRTIGPLAVLFIGPYTHLYQDCVYRTIDPLLCFILCQRYINFQNNSYH